MKTQVQVLGSYLQIKKSKLCIQVNHLYIYYTYEKCIYKDYVLK